MKGSPLSVWNCVLCYEAAPLGPTLALVLKHTGLSTPSAKRAVQFLLDHLLIREERGDDGEARYRVSAYAWYGPEEEAPQGIASDEDGEPRATERTAATGPPKKIFFAVAHDDDDVDLSGSGMPAHHQHQIFGGESKKIFLQGGVDPGRELERLAETVLPERAARWVDRLPHAPQSFSNPVGFMIATLSRDPEAEPPGSWKLPHWDGPVPLSREDLTDREWERMNETNRQAVLEGHYYSDGYIR